VLSSLACVVWDEAESKAGADQGHHKLLRRAIIPNLSASAAWVEYMHEAHLGSVHVPF